MGGIKGHLAPEGIEITRPDFVYVPDSNELPTVIFESAVFVYHGLNFLHRRFAIFDYFDNLRPSLHAFRVQQRMRILGITGQAVDGISHGFGLS